MCTNTIGEEGDAATTELEPAAPQPQAGQSTDRTRRRREKKRRKQELRKMANNNAAHSQTPNDAATASATSPPAEPSQPVLNPKPLIVLDLNGILCHRVRRTSTQQTNSNTIYRPSLGHVANTDVVPRSDLHEFLTLLNDNFRLAVWTSATRRTARELVRLLIPAEVRARLVFVWHRNFCHLVDNAASAESSSTRMDGGENTEGEGGKGMAPDEGRRRKRRRRKRNASRIEKLCNVDGECIPDNCSESNGESNASQAASHENVTAIKCLSKVFERHRSWNATNTILLDDSPEKCPDRHSKNALHPPPICGTVTRATGDGADGTMGPEADDANSGEISASMIDDDEANQRMQRDFFRLLAEHWSQPTQDLMAFLDAHADSHNMR